jgi:dihydropyrimidinase
MRTLIKNGRVITASDDAVADLLIEDGVIAHIGRGLPVANARVIDATGMYVMPGGVDPHTHMEMPFGGTTTCDDFTSGTVAAAFGGTTTIVDFCIQQHEQTFEDALAAWHEKADRCKPVGDYGFHLAVTDLDGGGGPDALARVPEAAGVTSFKLFMAYKDALMVDDGALFRTMEVAHNTGAMVLVHAENGEVIEILIRQALAAGHTDPIWHARTRPPQTEAEATHRAIELAGIADCALYVVHVSCEQALKELAHARRPGRPLWGETCIQYLFVDESWLEEADFGGGKYVFTPPPRTKHDHEALWRGLADRTLSAVTSDHCPFRWRDQKSLGREDFSQIPNGAPTIEHRLHMLHHHGVRQGRISLNRLVELFATQPARLFGLYPKKGTIAIGSDADLVIFDPQRELTISAAAHHSRVDYNVFEGEHVVGAPHAVLLRGQPVVEDGELVAEPGLGEFVRRARAGQRWQPDLAAAA